MYPLQIINYTESLLLTFHAVNQHFIHHLHPHVKIYWIGHNSETGDIFKQK